MMNTQPRMFRGRGGPTDRRLPKHNAARRRAPRRVDGRDAHVSPTSDHPVAPLQVVDDEEEPLVIVDSSPAAILTTTDSTTRRMYSIGDDDEEEEPTKVPAPPPHTKEIKHLQKRIQNVQETLQLSNSISNPATYESNVLNAVGNCFNEWRSIATHHEIPLVERSETGRAIFGLIQHSLQCGPLAGSKPGYFKRCGSQVAAKVLAFLDSSILPVSPPMAELLGWTPKQLQALETWRLDAQKAVDADKPPSRSQLLKQQGRKGKGKKASSNKTTKP